MQVKWTLHDCWAFTGHCSHFSYVGCDRWRTGCHHCMQSKEYPASLLADRSRKNYLRKKKAFQGVKNMTIITPSHWLANLVKRSFLKEYPVQAQHSTIDRSIFKPTQSNFREKMGLTDKKIVLGVASAWSEKKGLGDFIRLSRLLPEGYTVLLIGVDEKQRKCLPQNILSLQRTNFVQELAEIYTTADVFVNLTYEDTFPTVNLEAQACGTPCLTYRTGGSVESVLPENIVEQGDLEEMVRKIRENCLE